MIVGQAKQIARQWIVEEASGEPGFRGAFFHGSVNWLEDDAALADSSDLDVMVVLEPPLPSSGPGKFRYRGVLLEVSYLESDRIQSPEQILGQYELAGSFRGPSIVLDPTGKLGQLQEAVSRCYAQGRWVRLRCQRARDKVLRYLGALAASDHLHEQVTTWLFGTGVTTHVLLVAGLRNPTVRRRYVAVRELLAEHDQLDLYEKLLELLGCAQWTRAQAEHHLSALSEAFDTARTLDTTPFFFGADLSDIARPIAIDGSRELIERGQHREAVFWLAATWSRCLKVLEHAAPVETQDRFSPGYRELLDDLGILSFTDLQQRARQVRALLPRICEVAEAIMAANPEVGDGAVATIERPSALS